MNQPAEHVAAITGAASGIGRALAEALAGRGSRLALADVDETGLAATASRVAAQGGLVTTAVVDVSNRERMTAWASEVVAEHGRVDLVVNNAGVAQSGSVQGNEFADYDWVLSINFWGVVNGTKAFLPIMREAGRGHIVNVASIFGVFAQPGMSCYNASKFAVRGFTESLRQELDLTRCGVSATCVIPGGIRTNIAESARMSPSLADLYGGPVDESQLRRDFLERLARTTPEAAAKTILAGVDRNARRVLIGADARLADLMQRLMPSLYQRLVVASMARMRRRVLAASRTAE